jgi:hypothetical protein
MTRYITGCLLALPALLLAGCTDETLDVPGHGKEGETATVTLNIEVPEMNRVQSRAMTEAEESQVNDIWIGIFNVATGKLVTGHEEEVSHNDDNHKLHTMTIDTKSGLSRIVAVANAKSNVGRKGTNSGNRLLIDLLHDVQSWEDYKQISAALSIEGDIDRYTSDFPMAGVYYDDKSGNPNDPSGYDNWVDIGEESTVFIPEKNGAATTLNGHIHLRRLHSHVTFNILEGENITVEPLTWRVVNVPTISYLHEQAGNSADDDDYKNAVVKPSGTRNKFGNATLNNGLRARTFDFYMMENKHVTPSECENLVNSYDDREREFKHEQTSPESSADNKTHFENSTIYKSLCPTETETRHNSATFVEITAKVTYYVSGADENGLNGHPTGNTGETPRIGYAKYTVHLGYCEGNGNAKARDFRHRRNVKYTYNVTVKSLDKIVVEAAHDGNEDKPGGEGDVIDLTNDPIYLDCHYVICNIELTDKDRREFKWRLKCPYGNGEVDLCSDFLTEEEKEKLSRNVFYRWVQIMPTRDGNTPAYYHPEKAMYLEDIKKVDEYPHTTDHRQGEDVKRWYTVFIDENTYAPHNNGIIQEGVSWEHSDWVNYVNQPDRRVWLGLEKINLSNDDESSYSRAKYVISQKSIQTYMKKAADVKNVVGVEHTNETLGKNFGWVWNNNLSGWPWSDYNGMINLWSYLDIRGVNTWDEIIQQEGNLEYNKFCHVNRIDNEQGYYGKDENRNIPELKVAVNHGSAGIFPTHPDQKDHNIYDIISSCMSRNRDLNGDGRITPDEVRWYLPTASVYLHMVLARDALSTPLMDFDSNPILFYPSNIGSKNQHYTRFHYATANKKYIFAEESISTGPLTDYESMRNGDRVNRYGFWEIRCIRKLGTDIKNKPDESMTVDNAYKDVSNGKFKYVHVYGLHDGAMRYPTTKPLGLHMITDFENRVAPEFEVAESDCNDKNMNYDGVNNDLQIKFDNKGNCTTFTGAAAGIGTENYYTKWFKSLNENSVCGNYFQEPNGSDRGTWRVPNQRELAILMNLGFFDRFNDIPNGDNWLWFSSTIEYYEKYNNRNTRRVVSAKRESNGTNTMTAGGTGTGHKIHVRCVRDVMK